MIPILFLFIYFIGGLIVFSLIVYFIVKRIEDKGKEDFEKRDN